MSHRFEIIENNQGEFHVRFKYSREVIIAIGGYESRAGAERAAEAMRRQIGGSKIAEAA